MENQFKHLSNFEINLMVAKKEMKGQPFIKYLPQRNIFGNDFSSEDGHTWADDSLYIVTESGKEQEINFCNLTGQWASLMHSCRINLSWYDSSEGGCCSTDTSFFVDFENSYNYPRAVALCYLIEKGLLEVEK